jgi:light-regulated signal transduction histidine kinase (bacteriophytochrome)
MQRLISDLLSYSRVGTRGKPLERVSGEDILQDALDNLAITIDDNQATITHDPLPTIMADKGQLVQLFQNLIGNAIKFHGENKPLVHISVKMVDHEWVFSVKDNGIGFDPQYAERIFVIFQRLHERSDYAGTGIGLAICKKIVERHGGRIWVETQIGQGSTFYFSIPDRAAA